MLAEKISEGVMIGHNERIVYANPAALKILKTDEKTLYRINPRDIIRDDYKHIHETMVEQVRGGQSLRNMVICCYDGDGKEIWVKTDWLPLEWKKEEGVLITFKDITRQREKRLIEKKESVRLQKENSLLRSKHMHPYGLAHLVGTSEKMQVVYDKMISAATIDENVILYGESGTGKELVAKSIHDLSERRNGPFIAVNCGAIPETLAESEFFGHKRGAFSGADMDKIGFFESADKGTLFLDEIGDIHVSLQVKLLRAVEGYGYSPVGTTQVKKSDIRIIAATNRDLAELVKTGKVREDFYFRIHIIPIHLPPLKERREDIPLLVYHFTRKMADGASKRGIPDDAVKKFVKHDWPGNVRELQNTISRYLAFGRVEFAETTLNAATSETSDNKEYISEGSDLNSLLNSFESRIILKALSDSRQNKSQAAKKLGVDRRSLQRKIIRLGL